MTTILDFSSDYVSHSLTDEQREFCEAMLEDSNRVRFFDLTTEQKGWINEYTLENLRFTVEQIGFDEAAAKVGLIVAECTREPLTDDDGDPLTDDEGKVQYGPPEWGKSDITLKNKVSGLVDSLGTAIPSGKGKHGTAVPFRLANEEFNRMATESNFTNLIPRMVDGWMLNGESMIKDLNNTGISEQHRCLALISGILVGKLPVDFTIKTCATYGVHPCAAITVDTGKSNTGADIFGSDPSICPAGTVQTPASYLGQTDSKELVDPESVARKRITKSSRAVAGLLALRLGGKNIHSSYPGGSSKATDVAYRLATSVFVNLDDFVSRVYSFLDSMDSKSRPCSVEHLATALALWQLADHDQIDTIPGRDGIDGGRPMDEVGKIKLDCESIVPLLQEVRNGGVDEGPLAEWVRAMNKSSLHDRCDKMAQVCRLVQRYFDDGEVTATDTKREAIGPQKGKNVEYTHFGGADVGPLKKAKKSDSE